MYIVGLALLGIVVGAFGTLVGAGGGFLLVPILILLYPQKNAEYLTSISLAVVFFNALSGTIAYARMKRIHYRSGISFALATVPGAVLGALTTYLVPRRLFDTLLGIFMLAASLYLIIRPQNPERPGVEDRGEAPLEGEKKEEPPSFPCNMRLGVALSFIVGYVSSLLGIGGGIIHVPLLVQVLCFPVHIATATSHFILALMALAGTITHIAAGELGRSLPMLIPLAVGVTIGAQLGAFLSNRLPGFWIIRSLAVALGFVAIRILIAAVFWH
jgi:uncharacterized protein